MVFIINFNLPFNKIDMKPTFKIIDEELNSPYWVWISDMINKLAEDRSKAIDDKMREFWITEENARNYHIDIHKTREWYNYKIYKKEKIWEFNI